MQFRTRAFFIFAFLFITVTSQAQVSLDSVQGAWLLYKCERPADYERIVMEQYPPAPHDNIWIFKSDSLFRMYFPYQCESISEVRIDSNRIFQSGADYPIASIRLDSGRLVAFVRNGFQLYFHRKPITGDSAKTIRVLQRDSVNYSLLLHRYSMVTHFSPDYEAAYDFKPPLPMESRIAISDSAAALRVVRLRVVYIQAGGHKRAFHVTEIRWVDYRVNAGGEAYWVTMPELVLTPGEWWEGETFGVIYQVEEKERKPRVKK